jgi:hypothetical protein
MMFVEMDVEKRNSNFYVQSLRSHGTIGSVEIFCRDEHGLPKKSSQLLYCNDRSS